MLTNRERLRAHLEFVGHNGLFVGHNGLFVGHNGQFQRILDMCALVITEVRV